MTGRILMVQIISPYSLHTQQYLIEFKTAKSCLQVYKGRKLKEAKITLYAVLYTVNKQAINICKNRESLFIENFSGCELGFVIYRVWIKHGHKKLSSWTRLSPVIREIKSSPIKVGLQYWFQQSNNTSASTCAITCSTFKEKV